MRVSALFTSTLVLALAAGSNAFATPTATLASLQARQAVTPTTSGSIEPSPTGRSCTLGGMTWICSLDAAASSALAAAGPAPTGRGACMLHVDHWHCEGDATVVATVTNAAAAAEASPTGRGNCVLHIDHWDCDGDSAKGHAGHSHAGGGHAGHSHGPSAEYGCGLAPLDDYDLGLHVGAIFILLASSATGTFLPILLHSKPADAEATGEEGLLGKIFFICKHFGTGIILSTAFIHLLSHAMLYFANECVGELQFESVGPAIAMGAIWLVFVIDFYLKSIRTRALASQRHARSPSLEIDHEKGVETSSTHSDSASRGPTDAQGNAATVQRVDLWMLEAGIIFHSILIGVTLGAATGSGWIALLIAITFHQLFEGIALGSRIALLPSYSTSTWGKVVMGLAYVLTTPLGIAIGVGVRNHFNTNSSSTLVTMGTLHALSAGVLIYTVMVELLSGDFIHNERMSKSSNFKSAMAILAITIGAAAMSVLGKWA